MTVCIHNGIVLSGLTNNQSRSAVLIKDSKIKDTFSEERFNEMHFGPDVRLIDAKGNYIVPGFIDTHIHGFKGNGTDVCTKEGMLQMSRDLAQYGVTAFNPTLYPSSIEEMKEKLKTITSVMGHEDGAKIMGVHLEGPFISPDKALILESKLSIKSSCSLIFCSNISSLLSELYLFAIYFFLLL